MGMPPVEPGAMVIRFDDAAATALRAALLDLADTLERTRTRESAAADAARRDWQGVTRTWFDGQHHQVTSALHHAALACRQAAEQIAAAQASAAGQQTAANNTAIWNRAVQEAAAS